MQRIAPIRANSPGCAFHFRTTCALRQRDIDIAGDAFLFRLLLPRLPSVSHSLFVIHVRAFYNDAPFFRYLWTYRAIADVLPASASLPRRTAFCNVPRYRLVSAEAGAVPRRNHHDKTNIFLPRHSISPPGLATWPHCVRRRDIPQYSLACVGRTFHLPLPKHIPYQR